MSAAGYIAKKVLKKCGIEVFSYVKEAAGVRCPDIEEQKAFEYTEDYKKMRRDLDPFYQEIYVKGRINMDMRFLEKADFADGGFPLKVLSSDGNFLHHRMTAQTATDDSPPVMYMFVGFGIAEQFSSGWQINPTYEVPVANAGFSRDYYWQVRVRDSALPVPNEGTPSDWWNTDGSYQPN